jgi:flagellar protein FlgJ
MAVAPHQRRATTPHRRSLDCAARHRRARPQGGGAEAAKQFESLFMQELMKSMRATTMSTGMLDNEGSKLGTEMLDTQLSTPAVGLKGGLSDAIMSASWSGRWA